MKPMAARFPTAADRLAGLPSTPPPDWLAGLLLDTPPGGGA